MVKENYVLLKELDLLFLALTNNLISLMNSITVWTITLCVKQQLEEVSSGTIVIRSYRISNSMGSGA